MNGSFVVNGRRIELFNPPYITPYEFEKFDIDSARHWMKKNAYLSVIASIAYIALIFTGQFLMRNRPAFNLKVPLILWNLMLAMFSIFGFSRVYPEFFAVLLSDNGLHRSLCVRDEHNISSAFWAFMFVLSKLIELGDTAFIVLRKRPLIFLHWYHHITVMVCCWYFYYDYEPIFRWYGTMNFFIHSNMYTYYFLRAIGFKPPKVISMTLTCLQITQMITGVLVNLYSYKLMTDGTDCPRSAFTFYSHCSLSVSYLILFANYFYKAYFTKSKLKSKKQE